MENLSLVKKRLYMLPLVVVLHFSMHAQIVQRQSIGTIGGSYQSGSTFVQQCVGQPFQTQGYYKKGLENRPGFIQAQLISIVPINNTFKKEIGIYPNPGSTEVQFVFEEGLENIQLKVYSIDGRRLMDEKIIDLSSYSIDCSSWPPSTYLLYLEDLDGNIYYAKLIKQ